MELMYLTSWLIAAIGFGVTILIGVNLWISLSINRRIKSEVNRATSLLREENEQLKKDLKNYSISYSFTSRGDEYMRLGASFDAIVYYLNALVYAEKSKDKNRIKGALKDCLDIVGEHPECLNEDNIKESANWIKESLLKIKHEDAYELYSYFLTLDNQEKETAQSQES